MDDFRGADRTLLLAGGAVRWVAAEARWTPGQLAAAEQELAVHGTVQCGLDGRWRPRGHVFDLPVPTGGWAGTGTPDDVVAELAKPRPPLWQHGALAALLRTGWQRLADQATQAAAERRRTYLQLLEDGNETAEHLRRAAWFAGIPDPWNWSLTDRLNG